MNNNILKSTLCLGLSVFAISASAQKKYTEGVVTLNVTAKGSTIEAKNYFTADSSAYTFAQGPANVKLLSNTKSTFFAVLIDIPVASRKIAAVAAPAEIEEGLATLPAFTFTPTEETQVISGFNCKKVVAKEATSGKSYDVWVTKDVAIPASALEKYYSKVDGYPIKFTAFQMGQEAEVTVTSIADQKLPKGTFGISNDYTRVTMAALAAMNSNR